MKNRLNWVAHDVERFEEPAFVFPNDDEVPGSYGDVITYDPKGKDYPRRTINGLLKVAGRYGLDVDLETYERVRRTVVGPEAADPYLDGGDTDIERRRRFGLLGEVVRVVMDPEEPYFGGRSVSCLQDEDPTLASAMRLWGNAVRVLDDGPRQAITWHALGTLEYSLEKAEAPDITEYARTGFVEGRHYGRMWVETVCATQPNPGDRSRAAFETWVTRGVSAITLLDSAVDLERDAHDGNVQFEPTLAARLALLRMGLVNVPSVIGPVAYWKAQSIACRLMQVRD